MGKFVCKEIIILTTHCKINNHFTEMLTNKTFYKRSNPFFILNSRNFTEWQFSDLYFSIIYIQNVFTNVCTRLEQLVIQNNVQCKCNYQTKVQ